MFSFLPCDYIILGVRLILARQNDKEKKNMQVIGAI